MVFSHLGKQHHYIQIDDETAESLDNLKKKYDKKGEPFRNLIQQIIRQLDAGGPKKTTTLRRK